MTVAGEVEGQQGCEAHRLALRDGCRHLADVWLALWALCSTQAQVSPQARRLRGIPPGRLSRFHSECGHRGRPLGPRIRHPDDLGPMRFHGHGLTRTVLLQKPRVSFHALRHTAGSWLTIRGASLRSVQEILGIRRQAGRRATAVWRRRTFGPTSIVRRAGAGGRETCSDGTRCGTIRRVPRPSTRHQSVVQEILSF